MKGKSSSTNQGHTHLYFALGILVIFAIVFFIVKQKMEAPPPPQEAVNTKSDVVAPQQMIVTLTPEQKKLQDEIQVAPSKPVKLTPQQEAAQKKIMEEMMNSAVTNQ